MVKLSVDDGNSEDVTSDRNDRSAAKIEVEDRSADRTSGIGLQSSRVNGPAWNLKYATIEIQDTAISK
jgi:hypothetical protein